MFYLIFLYYFYFFNKKENEIKQLINDNNSLLKTQYLQLDVSNPNNNNNTEEFISSNYTFNMNNIINNLIWMLKIIR